MGLSIARQLSRISKQRMRTERRFAAKLPVGVVMLHVMVRVLAALMTLGAASPLSGQVPFGTSGPIAQAIDTAWPPVTARPVPVLPGALLPGSRIIAYYGNPMSTQMGILGALPPEEMLNKL